MSKHPKTPCASWAEYLTQANSTHLSGEERAAFHAHLMTCPACAAVYADALQSAAILRRGLVLDPLPGLPPLLLQLWAEEDRQARSRFHLVPLSGEMEHAMQTDKEQEISLPPPSAPAAPPPQKHHTSRQRIFSAFTAVAALVLITVIMAGLLASHIGQSSQAGHSGTQTATPSVTQTATPAFSGQSWVSVPGLTEIQDHPFIAPSNPHIIYEVTSNPTTLRRTDDRGTTWRTLPLPLPATEVQDATVGVYPSNAQTIVLNASVAPAFCTSGQTPSKEGGCLARYYSTDGGEHWLPVPQSASLDGVGSVLIQGFEIVGNHLYGWVASGSDISNTRVIYSDDGGNSWQFADETIVAQGQWVCGFATSPTDSTVFAETQQDTCANPDSSQWHSTIWRSDDAGAHWSQVGTFPYSNPNSGLTGLLLAGNQFALLGSAGVGLDFQWVLSTNGGKTWQIIPTNGLPENGTTSGIPGTVLSDGSILATASSGSAAHVTFYAWKPGTSSWHQVSPLLDSDWDSVIGVSSNGGHDTLWVVTQEGDGVPGQQTFTVKYFPLQ